MIGGAHLASPTEAGRVRSSYRIDGRIATTSGNAPTRMIRNRVRPRPGIAPGKRLPIVIPEEAAAAAHLDTRVGSYFFVAIVAARRSKSRSIGFCAGASQLCLPVIGSNHL